MNKLSPQAREAIEFLYHSLTDGLLRAQIIDALDRHDAEHNPPPEPEPLWAKPGEAWMFTDGKARIVAGPDEAILTGDTPRVKGWDTKHVWVFLDILGSKTCGWTVAENLHRIVDGIKHPCAGYAPAREWS